MSQGYEDYDAFGLDDVDPSKCQAGGSALPEGFYHVGITGVVLHDERKGNCQITMEVLAAKEQNLVGREYNEFLSWPSREKGETYNRIKAETLLAWVLAGKVIDEATLKARKEAKQGFDPKWLDQLFGRDLIIKIEKEEYTDNKGQPAVSFKIEKRVWSWDNPKMAGMPLAYFRKKPSDGQGGAGVETPPATPPAAPAGGLSDLPI